MSKSVAQGAGLIQPSFRLTPALSSLLRDHTKYMAQLSVWDQYLVWRYTFGSGQINKTLIGNSDEDALYWVYFFFLHYNTKVYGTTNIPAPYDSLFHYFLAPRSFLQAPIAKQKQVIPLVIHSFIRDIQALIMAAPTVREPITVFKISTIYDPLLSDPSVHMFTLSQKPFNSTTYDPQFEFGYFLAQDQVCCLWEITVPVGSHVLAINPTYHAYPFEKEILIPHGALFKVTSRSKAPLEFVWKQDLKLETVQIPPLVIGEVYRPLPYYRPPVQTMDLPLLKAVLET